MTSKSCKLAKCIMRFRYSAQSLELGKCSVVVISKDNNINDLGRRAERGLLFR